MPSSNSGDCKFCSIPTHLDWCGLAQAGDGTPDWDSDMAEWERQYGAAWRAFYGQVVMSATQCWIGRKCQRRALLLVLTKLVCAGLCAASAACREGSAVS